MSTAELIYERSRALPPELQRQVLDFVAFLDQRQNPPQDDWTELSLAGALRGMETEQWPEYPDHSLVEDWR
jgi:hypothetical protein